MKCKTTKLGRILSLTEFKNFFFYELQIKLVDVEKVEWSNRRSYSAIGLFLGNREGRVLLRCDQGLEDWFELLDVCDDKFDINPANVKFY